jgi:NAD(P)-dependent dehydrogenase (short-subunit alcohol dehydrogenase family)
MEGNMETIVITGASSGIGFAVVQKLLEKNYRVIGIGRTKEHCEEAKEKLKTLYPAAEVAFFYGDIGNRSGQEKVCAEVIRHIEEKCGGNIYALINNAGCVPGRYTTTEEGFERQFAVNHLAGFYITYRLIRYIKKGGRILFTGSNSHVGARIRWKDVMLTNFYNPLSAYKQSKLCNMLTAYGLNERCKSMGITAYVVDPGLVNTEIGCKGGPIVKFVWSFRKKHGTSPQVPAQTYLYLCENTPEGLYFYNSRPVSYSKRVTQENSDRLWALSEKLCGIYYADNMK